MYIPDFKQSCVGHLGAEVEYGLFQCGIPAPLSFQFMKLVEQEQGKWMMDLPAWQVEYATPPCRSAESLRTHLENAFQKGQHTAEMLGCKFRACEVAPDCRETYVCSPVSRYKDIISDNPKQKWGPGCRVAGTHFHYGCKDLKHAIEVHNRLARKVEVFCEMGLHHSGNEPSRIDLYRRMAPVADPPIYSSIEEWKHIAKQEEFDKNLSDCWHFVRISVHGTVEVRCFGVTFDLREIMEWARKVHSIAEGG